MQAVNKVGAPFAAAILGSVLNATYQGRLDLTGVPANIAHGMRESVFAGVAAVACLIPAARSLRIDPVEALRRE